MLSSEEINDIHYQLNHMPLSITKKRKRELRHELNKALKEHKYASTYPSFKPTEYEIVFVNRITPINTLITLNTRIKDTNIFTLDTESVMKKFQSNVPALIQLQLCTETPSMVIIVEVHHLPKQNQEEFQLIKNLFNSLFIKKNKIFIWGGIEELEGFTQFGLFNLQQIYSSTNRNVQHEFKSYWEQVYPHHENRNEECQCKSCFGIDHNNPLALQDAVAFELRQWLDKRLTCQSFNIGLDPKLRKLNPRELQYRQSLYTYAANDCDAINRIIIHSDIVNNQYSEAASINKFIDEMLFDEINDELGNDELNDEIILDGEGHVMIIDESLPIINSTIGSITTPPIVNDEPFEAELELETISSDEPYELETISSDELEPPTINNQQSDRPTTKSEYVNPLSKDERRIIHNKSRTRHQRIRAYTHEVILFDIEKKFPIRVMKQTLKIHGIPVTQINRVQSNRTGQYILFVGSKQPVSREKYEEIKELFTNRNYRRLFPHKYIRRKYR